MNYYVKTESKFLVTEKWMTEEELLEIHPKVETKNLIRSEFFDAYGIRITIIPESEVNRMIRLGQAVN